MNVFDVTEMAAASDGQTDHDMATGGTGGPGRQEMDQADGEAVNSNTRQQPQTVTDSNNGRRRTAVFVHGPMFTVRDRVFHALFYRLALIYSRAVPHKLRRVIEFALLFEVPLLHHCFRVIN